MGISQSGQSPDIVAVLSEVNKQGSLTAAVTNNVDSPLARTATHIVDMNADVEKSVASTKTYTASLMAIAMLSVALTDSRERWKDLTRIPEAVEQTLRLDQAAIDASTRWRFANRCVVIGRGYNYATTFELALKLKEQTYIIAEPYSPADFIHGPFAMVNREFPVLVIAPQGAMLPTIKNLLVELRQQDADILIISDDHAIMKLGDVRLQLSFSVPEWLSPFTTAIAGQLFAMRLAEIKRRNIDKPRGLNKVTKTL